MFLGGQCSWDDQSSWEAQYGRAAVLFALHVMLRLSAGIARTRMSRDRLCRVAQNYAVETMTRAPAGRTISPTVVSSPDLQPYGPQEASEGRETYGAR